MKLSLAEDAAALDPACSSTGSGAGPTTPSTSTRRTTTPPTSASPGRAPACGTAPTTGGRSRRRSHVDGDEVVRDEHAFAGGPGRPPSGAVDLVLGWTRGAPVVEVATVRTHRRRLRLLADEGAARARGGRRRRPHRGAAGAAGDVPRGGGRARRGTVTRRTFDRVVRRLRASGATSGAGPSKVAHALGAAARAAADVADPTDLEADAGLTCSCGTPSRRRSTVSSPTTTWSGSATIPRACTRPASRPVGCGPTSAPSGPLLDPAWADGLRDELRWIGTELGPRPRRRRAARAAGGARRHAPRRDPRRRGDPPRRATRCPHPRPRGAARRDDVAAVPRAAGPTGGRRPADRGSRSRTARIPAAAPAGSPAGRGSGCGGRCGSCRRIRRTSSCTRSASGRSTPATRSRRSRRSRHGRVGPPRPAHQRSPGRAR